MVILAGAIPPLVAAIGSRLDFRRAQYFTFAIFGLCLSIPLSYLGQTEMREIAYVAIVYYVFACMIVLISVDLDADVLLRSFFTAFALINTASMAAVLIDHDVAWGRLMGRTAPNYWGAIAQATILSAIAMRGWVLRAIVVGFSLFILHYTQSRGSMIALALGFGFLAALVFFTVRGKAWLWLSVGLGVLLLGILGADFVANDLLKLSDPLRGLGSGVTGRADAWAETWDLFVAHPWVGVGYRQHEQYLLSETSAHNGYLATMAEMGVIGLISYLVFILGGFTSAILKVRQRVTAARLAAVVFIFAYVVTGLVERVGLNTGNAYSLALIIVTALAWRLDGPDVADRKSVV
jgi:O-antigen ligase